MSVTVSDTPIWVCDDCTIFAVNGDMPENTTPERDREILAGAAEYPLIVPDYNSDTGEGLDEFSWRPCECCGSTLGGARTRFVQLVNEETTTGDVCATKP